jgi:DNA invertase Pin-like site-specific DNA recombinase
MTDDVIGYIRVSTEDQANSGLGMLAQERAIREYADRMGITISRIYRDEAQSAKSTEKRDGLNRALDECRAGKAKAIVVARVDRAFRSAHDFFAIYEEGQKGGWNLIPLDLPGVDPTSPQGGMILGIFALFAQYERQLIGTRTREALAELKAQGKPVGRPPLYSMNVRKLARQCYYYGWTVDYTMGVLHALIADPPSRRTIARMMRDESVSVPQPFGGAA